MRTSCGFVNYVLIRYYSCMSAEHYQYVLERLLNVLRNERRGLLLAYGLQPVQFDVLNYLAMANRYSDTPMAVTEFLGLTKGTVSQTLKVLEKEGLLLKVCDLKDKRVVHLQLTPRGRRLVQEGFPSKVLKQVLDKQPMTGSSGLERLSVLLRTLQQANAYRSFGECRTCMHNQHLPSGMYRCALTGEELSQRDTELICREHSLAEGF